MAKVGPTKITGKNGGEFYVGDTGDMWLPPFPMDYPYPKHLEVLRNIKIRDDDVILAGYPKSGSNWFYEIIHMLKAGKAEYQKSCKVHQMLDMLTEDQIEAIPSPRILNTHVLYRQLPKEAIEKKTKTVILHRNPKDAAVSLFHHMTSWEKGGYTGTWDSFFDIYIDTGLWYGTWFDMTLDWEQTERDHPDFPVLNVFYEQALKDPADEIYKLSEFLELDRTRELCEQIADKCSFQNLKAANETTKDDPFKTGFWKNNQSGFFRKGKSGDWRNKFTVAQSERFDELYNSRMKDSKIEKVYSSKS